MRTSLWLILTTFLVWTSAAADSLNVRVLTTSEDGSTEEFRLVAETGQVYPPPPPPSISYTITHRAANGAPLILQTSEATFYVRYGQAKFQELADAIAKELANHTDPFSEASTILAIELKDRGLMPVEIFKEVDGELTASKKFQVVIGDE